MLQACVGWGFVAPSLNWVQREAVRLISDPHDLRSPSPSSCFAIFYIATTYSPSTFKSDCSPQASLLHYISWLWSLFLLLLITFAMKNACTVTPRSPNTFFPTVWSLFQLDGRSIQYIQIGFWCISTLPIDSLEVLQLQIVPVISAIKTHPLDP